MERKIEKGIETCEIMNCVLLVATTESTKLSVDENR